MFFVIKTKHVAKFDYNDVFVNVLFTNFRNIKFEIVFISIDSKNTSKNAKSKINASKKKTTTTTCIFRRKRKFKHLNFEFYVQRFERKKIYYFKKKNDQ